MKASVRTESAFVLPVSQSDPEGAHKRYLYYQILHPYIFCQIFLKCNQLILSFFSSISANSSRTILEANEEFKSMSGTIQLGRKLITKYNRRELTDKLLIFLALALFLATVLYILKKRLFPFL